jgi:kinetochore protein Nuf2
MAHYSYPLLPSDEILTVLREMKIDANSDDLANPTPLKVKVIFDQLIEVLLNQKSEDMAQPHFNGLEMLEHQELHEESIGAIGFMHGCTKLMTTAGVTDFSIHDLLKPESKRLRRFISAAINFAKFREDKMQMAEAIIQEMDELAAQKQQAEDENERLVNQLRSAQAVREQEAPETQRLGQENEVLAKTVQEAFDHQTQVHNESMALKEELEKVKDHLAETKFKVVNAKEELEQLKQQIVPDPKKLKSDLQALQDAVAHEKENLKQVEGACCESSRQLEAVERAEREMEAVTHAQQECEAERAKLHEVQAAIKESGERRHRDEASRTQHNFETKEIKVRKERKEEQLAKLQQTREKKLEAADASIADAQAKLGGLNAARDQQTKALEKAEAEIRELNDTLYRARMEHDADTVRVQQQQQQLAAQVRAYHQDLLDAMRQVSDAQAQAA